MKKINSINFGGKMIAIGILLTVLLPGFVRIIWGKWLFWCAIPGATVLLVFIVIFAIEMRQDNAGVPYYEKHLKETIPFDRENQIPLIKSSICTGEKVAGFKNKNTGHFTEVMVIRNEEEKKRFMKIYEIDHIDTQY